MGSVDGLECLEYRRRELVTKLLKYIYICLYIVLQVHYEEK